MRCSFVTAKTRAPVLHQSRAQSIASLLWRRLLALHHHQLLSAPAAVRHPRSRDLLVHVLEQVRRRYRFVLVGCVVMPEHVHLLISEPERGNPSVVMQAIKQGFARRLLARLRQKEHPDWLSLWSGPVEAGHVWQARFYNFVVFSDKKWVQELRYMHRNPIKRGLVLAPEVGRGAAIDIMHMTRLGHSW